MKSKIVSIGNSRGIRIPKPMLERVGLSDEVLLSVEGGALVVRPLPQARAGWAEAFRAMAEQGDDVLVDEPVATDFDAEEWEWR